MIWSCATGVREPCQVLTEAALSGLAGVPQDGLIGATCQGSAWKRYVEGWVRGIFILIGSCSLKVRVLTAVS